VWITWRNIWQALRLGDQRAATVARRLRAAAGWWGDAGLRVGLSELAEGGDERAG